jgi:hypothetical protein
MKTVAWMVGAGLVSWLATALGFGRQAMTATLLGMAAPLGVAVASWLVSERTWRREPQALTRVMTIGFVGKMVFFGAYVAVVIKGWSQPPVPFAVSFAGSFIALLFIEALALKRLFAS